MPFQCSVPECRSNFRGEKYTTVFKFPSEKRRPELRQKWIRSVPRKNWIPTDNSVVCIKHFTKEDIITADTFKDATGVEHIIQRRCPVLKPEAYPTVYPCLPSYLSTKPVLKRQDPNTRAGLVQQRHDRAVAEWLEADLINDFKTLQSCYDTNLQQQLKGVWHHVCVSNEYVLLYTLNVQPNRVPAIALSIKIVEDLSFNVYLKTGLLDIKSLKWLCSSGKIERWSQLENLLSYCLCKDVEDDVTVNDCLTKTHENLVQAINLLSTVNNTESDVTVENLQFLDEQLSLMRTHDRRKRYSGRTQCFAFMAYIKSPSCYRFLRKSKLLFLPHPSRLKNLIPMSKSSDFNNVKYLEIKCNKLSAREKIVAVQMDEIYVKAALSYTGGKLIGTASNAKESATTVQAFMISSVFGNYTEVVGLIPMKKMTACDLQVSLLQTIQCVQSAGFTVLVVIADNNAVNRRVYKELSAPGTYSFDNPQHSGQPIFLLHDSVHLLKCIWHNWLNLKDADQTFICPPYPINTAEQVMKATLSSLKSVYTQDRHNIVKLAPALTHKALYPSNLDRQKVPLALGVFNHYNIAALQLASQNDSANFIQIILQWWNIVNVKSKFGGTKTRNPFAQPVTKEDQSNLMHLVQFVKWLEAWQNMDGRIGKLSTETFNALIRTVHAVIQMSNYALSTLNIEYLLLGKLQTDNLEARFGEYRQLSGANYLVSVQQILEAERKLKIYSILCMYSSRCGDVIISDLSTIFSTADTDTEEQSSSKPTGFSHSWFEMNIEDCDIIVPDGTMEVIIYISGFVAFRVSKKLKCSTCRKLLQQDKSLTVDMEPDLTITSWLEYTKLLDRGGLKYPSQPLTILSLISYIVVQILISPEYEQKFLTSCNQKKNCNRHCVC